MTPTEHLPAADVLSVERCGDTAWQIAVRCPSCKQRLAYGLPEPPAGHVRRCRCGQRFSIPSAVREAEELPVAAKQVDAVGDDPLPAGEVLSYESGTEGGSRVKVRCPMCKHGHYYGASAARVQCKAGGGRFRIAAKK